MSALDVAKLVAALHDSDQNVSETFGIGLLESRRTFLACFPTTSGTGSEVSPNAILLDESDLLKKGVVSPHLVPDVAFVDPLLTHSVPPAVTAATRYGRSRSLYRSLCKQPCSPVGRCLCTPGNSD